MIRRPLARRDSAGEAGTALQSVAGAAPGVARVLGSAAWHTGLWGVRTSAGTTARVAKAVVDRDERGSLLRDAAGLVEAVTDVARGATGIGGAAAADADAPRGPLPSRAREPEEADPATLRRRGAELLQRSRDVWATEEGHPAYARILSELAPDEARILLLMLEGGPQPSVDVRTGGPGGMVSSQLIAPGMSMIGARAGLRYPDRVPAYLNNLFRLGLIWFAKEPLRDSMAYQVLEAQPDVLEALHSVRFAKVIRRSIHLTPFGEGFSRMTLVEPACTESEDFPPHEPPEPREAADPPVP